MNTCESFSESFSDYVENAVLPEQRQTMDVHLSRCSSCQATVARLSSLRSRLRTLPRVKTSPDFEAILRARIMLERKKSRVSTFAPRVARMPRAAVYALAGLTILLATSVILRGWQSPEAYTKRALNSEEFYLYQTTPNSPLQPTKVSYTLDKIRPGYLQRHEREATAHDRAVSPDSILEKQTLPPGQQLKTSSF